MEYTRRELTAWMFKLTRPVLAPLLASSAARVADQMLGVIMLAFVGWQVGEHFSGTPLANWKSVLILLGIALLKALLRYLEQFSGHFVAFKALELLRRHAFLKLYPQAPAISRSSRSGDLLVRLTRDIDRIEVFFAHTFAPAVSAILVPLFSCVLFFFLGAPNLALIALGFNFLALPALLFLGAGSAEVSSGATLRTRAKVVEKVSDIVGGNSEIRGYGLEEKMLSDLSEQDADLSRITIPTHLVLGVRRATNFGLMLLMAVVMIAVATREIAQGTLYLSAAIATIAGSIRGWESVRGVEDFSVFLLHSFASAARLRTLTEGKPTPDGGTSPLPQGPLELRAEDVTFHYTDSSGMHHQTLHSVSLCVPAGQWHALVGPTGCGKSTLANLLVRVEDPASGNLYAGTKNLREVNVESLRQSVVYVPQRAHLFNNSVAENLRLAAPEATEEELWHALEVVKVAEEVRGWKDGLETRLGAKGEAVSGGQRQRLALARALLMRPRALILDEATAHLNPSLAAEVRAAVRRELPEATILEITHRVDQLDGCTKVHRMNAGQLVG
ncbi:ABC transporter ATP-binding protein/permease [Actinomycetaceae bacterium TAE3-ERU4]|nr:ABC transporter ATP-binding protein/permease [Actinomycetaceae bacterium TAE3-ERU4]